MKISCFQFFVQYFTKLFVIISPLAIIAMFVSMTAHFSHKEKMNTAKTGSIVAYGTMLFFALTGQKLFEFLGITMGSFYIAGGVIILLIGLLMLRAEDPDESLADDVNANASKKKQKIDIAITPFGIPIICGPCCITAVITFQSQAEGFCQGIAGLLAITMVSASLCALLIASAHGAKWLTPTILKLSYRLSGLILAALAIQLMISGLRHPDIGVLSPQKVERSCRCNPCDCNN